MAVMNVTTASFDAEVKKSDKPVLVDFFATWCGPCKMLGPVVEALADTYPGLKVARVDTDQNAPLAVGFGISSIPALLVFKGGEVIGNSVGYRDKADLEGWLRGLGVI